MAKFTIELKHVVKLTGGTTEIVNGQRVITGGDLGLNHYPIFSEPYRAGLNGRIVDHYWNREIGLETIEMFQLAMRRKMNEIMPYYNQLYLSQQIEFDPLSTIDLHTVSAGETIQNTNIQGETTSESTNESHSRAVNSDTPQTQLSGDGDYATAGTDVNGNGLASSTANEDSTQSTNSDSSGDTTVTGYQGLASDLIMRYRESLINIDLTIINAVEDCFMLVWSNGDSYTKGLIK